MVAKKRPRPVGRGRGSTRERLAAGYAVADRVTSPVLRGCSVGPLTQPGRRRIGPTHERARPVCGDVEIRTEVRGSKAASREAIPGGADGAGDSEGDIGGDVG